VTVHPVVMAGGSGTRFWPLSRKARPKQFLALATDRPLIVETVNRLRGLATPARTWVVCGPVHARAVRRLLPRLPAANVIVEPIARNTAPAIGLATLQVQARDPDGVLAILPSDHHVADVPAFQAVLRRAAEVAQSGALVTIGIKPTRPETGYGYIECGAPVEASAGVAVRRVKRFTEKPNRELAEAFVAARTYAWNGGIFLWTARTLTNAIKEHCPAMAPLLERIADAYGTPEFDCVFAELYPQCENISIDYAVLEPRSVKGEMGSEIYCLPADFGWNDLGCWSALHEHVADCGPEELARKNVFDKSDQPCINIDSRGNYVYAPGKAVALVGVNDLVVVETGDALLITTRERSQDVGKVVAELKQAGREDLV